MDENWLMGAVNAVSPILGPAAPIVSGIAGFIGARSAMKKQRREDAFSNRRLTNYTDYNRSMAESNQRDYNEAAGQAYMLNQFRNY